MQNKRWIELINKWAFDSRPNNRPKVRQTTCFLFVFLYTHNTILLAYWEMAIMVQWILWMWHGQRRLIIAIINTDHAPNVVRYVVDHHRPILGDRFQIAARAAAIQLRT